MWPIDVQAIHCRDEAGEPSEADPAQDAALEPRDHCLVDAARAHTVVVRLKGGDPMLFGRAREELAALEAADIPYEIVPGVTSALGAAAEAGVSLTQRGVARSVAFVTPRVGEGEAPSEWAKVAAAADTTVIYMGKRTFPALAEALIAHGLPPETPALLAESVSTPEQTLHRSTVADLAARLAEDRSPLPGLILVGNLAMGVAD